MTDEATLVAKAMYLVDWPKDNWERLGEGSFHQSRYKKMAEAAITTVVFLRGWVDYAAKCKRKRTDGPTPCLCCAGECVG